MVEIAPVIPFSSSQVGVEEQKVVLFQKDHKISRFHDPEGTITIFVLR